MGKLNARTTELTTKLTARALAFDHFSNGPEIINKKGQSRALAVEPRPRVRSNSREPIGYFDRKRTFALYARVIVAHYYGGAHYIIAIFLDCLSAIDRAGARA